MGYETYHWLEVLDPGDMQPMPDDVVRAIISALHEECEGASYAVCEDGSGAEACKWYESEEDMRTFSKKYPDILFKMHGDGEESDDFWVHYYMNGRVQRCPGRIEFDPFDPAKLEGEEEVDDVRDYSKR